MPVPGLIVKLDVPTISAPVVDTAAAVMVVVQLAALHPVAVAKPVVLIFDGVKDYFLQVPVWRIAPSGFGEPSANGWR